MGKFFQLEKQGLSIAKDPDKMPSRTIVRKTIPSNNYPVKRSIVKGETLSGISNELNMSIDQILKLNPQIKDPDNIRAGETLNLGDTFKKQGSFAKEADMKKIEANIEKGMNPVAAVKKAYPKWSDAKVKAFISDMQELHKWKQKPEQPLKFKGRGKYAEKIAAANEHGKAFVKQALSPKKDKTTGGTLGYSSYGQSKYRDEDPYNKRPIHKGETLSGILSEYDDNYYGHKYTMDELLEHNPNIKDPNKITAGETINIPKRWSYGRGGGKVHVGGGDHVYVPSHHNPGYVNLKPPAIPKEVFESWQHTKADSTLKSHGHSPSGTFPNAGQYKDIEKGGEYGEDISKSELLWSELETSGELDKLAGLGKWKRTYERFKKWWKGTDDKVKNNKNKNKNQNKNKKNEPKKEEPKPKKEEPKPKKEEPKVDADNTTASGEFKHIDKRHSAIPDNSTSNFTLNLNPTKWKHKILTPLTLGGLGYSGYKGYQYMTYKPPIDSTTYGRASELGIDIPQYHPNSGIYDFYKYDPKFNYDKFLFNWNTQFADSTGNRRFTTPFGTDQKKIIIPDELQLGGDTTNVKK